MEKPTDINEYRRERIKLIQRTITEKVSLFLEVNGISNAEILWDDKSNIFNLSFSLLESDTKESLLTHGDLHTDLLRFLQRETIEGLDAYIINPYVKTGFISFIKE